MIYYRNDVRASGVDGHAIKRAMHALLLAVGKDDASVCVSLVNDRAIRELNRVHRRKDAPTDVLSFSLDPQSCAPTEAAPPEHMLGDIVISLQTARRQAADYDASLQAEVYRLLIHGLLHLLGHDHMKADESSRMEREERRLARAIGLPWPYEEAS